ncbi:MAG: DUF72 domain-containing protein [Chitinophagaceae bacterium]
MLQADNKKHGILRVGTSNIVLPGNKMSFPPAFQKSSRLTYYSSLFNTVEVNSSFYKVPLPRTLERWCSEVSRDFQFTIKLWKNITHTKLLDYNPQEVDFFMQTIRHLDNKKGCLLIQLPGKISVVYFEQVCRLLLHIQRCNLAPKWRVCIEFRHDSWYSNQTWKQIADLQVWPVLHDMPAAALRMLPYETPVVYLRFHGVLGDYKGSYSKKTLDGFADQIARWLAAGKDVYAYFNNTMGSAFDNAQYLNSRFMA